MAVKIDNLTKRYGDLVVIDDLNVDVERGEFISIVGPSGCGKSTLLQIIAGSLPYEGGQVEYKEDEEQISFVYQSPRLLDWRTVRKNLELVLEPTDIPQSEYDQLIYDHLEMTGLDDILNAYPRELSGGMQSRVALIRGLIIPSDIVLMDEPLGDIDELTAREIRDEIINLWQQSENEKTILYITHNVFEAVYMSDRVMVMGEKPTNFIDEISIDIPRPRNLNDERLFDLQNEVFDALP